MVGNETLMMPPPQKFEDLRPDAPRRPSEQQLAAARAWIFPLALKRKVMRRSEKTRRLEL